MRDLHCHILPGVDDGSPNMEYSLRMLDAAKKAGVAVPTHEFVVNTIHALEGRPKA